MMQYTHPTGYPRRAISLFIIASAAGGAVDAMSLEDPFSQAGTELLRAQALMAMARQRAA